MANRAYLYASDSEDGIGWEIPEDGEYFDSRWTIPWAWWFLFTPMNLKIVDEPCFCSEGVLPELRFITDRLVAIDRFKSYRQRLDAIVNGRLEPHHIEFFETILSRWPGQNLFMVPDEILQGDPGEEAALVLPVLEDLNKGQMSNSEFARRLQHASGDISDIHPDKAEVRIIGYTYGPIGHELWPHFFGSAG